MPVKKRGGTHVPRITGVTHEPSSSSRPGAANSDNATKHVTLASLAGDIAEIKLEIDVLVDWVRALENALADKD